MPEVLLSAALLVIRFIIDADFHPAAAKCPPKRIEPSGDVMFLLSLREGRKRTGGGGGIANLDNLACFDQKLRLKLSMNMYSKETIGTY